MLGLVGKKIGMSRIYDSKGSVIPVTLIQLYECCVSEVNPMEDKDYNNVVLSYDEPKNAEKKLSKAILGIYKKKNLKPYSKMTTVRMSKDKTFNIGDILKADLLNGVNLVDVKGNVLASFSSIKEASEMFEEDRANGIQKCCSGLLQTYHGRRWCHAN